MKSRSRISAIIAITLFAASIVASRNSSAADSKPPVAIKIDNFSFPQTVTVPAGTEVTWTNQDDIPHTVVSAGKFRSKTLDTDDKFTFTFTNAGDYKYFCSLHPHMTGMIKVE